jgi:hypothetical protein
MPSQASAQACLKMIAPLSVHCSFKEMARGGRPRTVQPSEGKEPRDMEFCVMKNTGAVVIACLLACTSVCCSQTSNISEQPSLIVATRATLEPSFRDFALRRQPSRRHDQLSFDDRCSHASH